MGLEPVLDLEITGYSVSGRLAFSSHLIPQLAPPVWTSSFVTAIDAAWRATGWVVRAEVVAPPVPTPNEIGSVEQSTAKAIGESVELTVRAHTDVVVTGTRYWAVEQLRAQDAREPASDE